MDLKMVCSHIKDLNAGDMAWEFLASRKIVMRMRLAHIDYAYPIHGLYACTCSTDLRWMQTPQLVHCCSYLTPDYT